MLSYICNRHHLRGWNLKTIALTLLLSCGASIAYAQKYVQIWGDEFESAGAPDNTKWRYEKGLIRNDELQYYTDGRTENARIEDGSLIIEARKEAYEGAEYTSASLISKGTGDWRYGKVEISAKIPSGKGTWPALWMMPTYAEYGGWPQSGEIDIMEHIGAESEKLHYTCHYEGMDGSGHESTGNGGSTAIEHPYDQYIKYTLIWTPDKLEWYANDVKYHEYLKAADDYRVWPFDKGFYLILNLAYGGTWGGINGVDDTKLPHKLFIDYVRVYQLQESEGPFSIDFGSFKNGSVTIDPELESYPEGTQVALTARPDDGFAFKAWKHMSGANPYTFTINKNMEMLPSFYDPDEMLTNSTFDIDWKPWGIYQFDTETASMTMEIIDSVWVLDITKSPGTNWHLGFQEGGLSLKKGHYILSFDAYAASEADMSITISKNYADWSAIVSSSVSITTTLKHHELELIMPNDDENVRLFFGIGKFSGNMHFDNISLKSIADIPTSATLTDQSIELYTGETHQFELIVKNQFDEIMDIYNTDIDWTCTTAAGTIDENGLFTAGEVIATGDVTAIYEGLSDDCNITINAIPTSLEETEYSNRIKIYPNPASSKIYIKHLEKSENITRNLQIFSSNGRMVYAAKMTNNESEVDTAMLTSGFYILKIRAKTYVAEAPLIIE